MPTLIDNTFRTILRANEAERANRSERLVPRVAMDAAGRLGQGSYRDCDERAAVARIILSCALLAAAQAGDPDIADLTRAIRRGKEAGGDGAERGHAAYDFVRALAEASQLPNPDWLLRRLSTAVFMTADDCSRSEWDAVLRSAEHFVVVFETARPRQILSATAALLRVTPL